MRHVAQAGAGALAGSLVGWGLAAMITRRRREKG
jgi:membrane protein YqaA with SNARE-associated domain